MAEQWKYGWMRCYDETSKQRKEIILYFGFAWGELKNGTYDITHGEFWNQENHWTYLAAEFHFFHFLSINLPELCQILLMHNNSDIMRYFLI